MKAIPFLILLLCAQCYVFGQKARLNEITIGQSAGYFFDSTRMVLSKSVLNKAPAGMTISYNRLTTRDLSWSVTFSSHAFVYQEDTGSASYPNDLILHRYIFRLSSAVSYRHSIYPFVLKYSGGLSAVGGHKANHLFNIFKPGWIEPVRDYQSYFPVGVTASVGAQHPIVWRFFGEFSAQYMRMLRKIDLNQLYLTYSLGYRF